MQADIDAAELKKKRTFRKFSFRGVELEQLVEMPTEKVPPLARQSC